MEQGKNMALFDELCFLSHHVDCWVHVYCLPWEEVTPGDTIGRRLAGGGSDML